MLSFFCLLSTKKVLNYPNNLIYITTYMTAYIKTSAFLGNIQFQIDSNTDNDKVY